MALTNAEKKAAQRHRDRIAGRRTIAVTLDGALVEWVDAEAQSRDETRGERVGEILQDAMDRANNGETK